MENPHKKQYPDLMAGKTIMYVHGFMSSAQSGTVGMLKEMLPEAHVIAEDMPIHPAEAVSLLKQLCQEHQPHLIVGSSMGGMYAEMLTGYHRILVNPAFEMGHTMHDHNMMGKQNFVNHRKDGISEIIVTKSLVNEYKEITTQCFANVTPQEQKRVYGLFGDKDPLVDTFDLFRSHYPQAVRFHGGHQLTDKIGFHYLIPVIRWIDDEQEGRQRPIVYIDYHTLHDAYGKPTSSMHKAYEMLIENYDVYILSDAPTNDHAALDAVQTWVEQYLSAPAYNKVVFINQRQLLYGDYLIAPSPEHGFMGTCLVYGSDELKTWEEMMVYFGRLGGQ